jgi:hypothetical protein
MRISFSTSTWLCLALYGVGAIANALSATTIFQIDFSADNEGGCATVGSARVQELLNEAVVLAETCVRLVNDYNVQPEANRLLDIFIRGNDATSRATFAGTYPEP